MCLRVHTCACMCMHALKCLCACTQARALALTRAFFEGCPDKLLSQHLSRPSACSTSWPTSEVKTLQRAFLKGPSQGPCSFELSYLILNASCLQLKHTATPQRWPGEILSSLNACCKGGSQKLSCSQGLLIQGSATPFPHHPIRFRHPLIRDQLMEEYKFGKQ